jgi:hydrogenase nickel incorporation protein HypB
MCEECGCGEPTVEHTHHDGHHHEHGHAHGDSHGHEHNDHGPATHRIAVNQNVMEKNDRYARENRAYFSNRKILALNLISSPGSGKTSLLEAMAKIFGPKMAVIEGDIQTSRDAERVIRAGSRAWQIETHGACHLDAHGVAHAVEQLDLDGCEIMVIENVGNLVCPATYDLGEHLKIAILSLPEGDDKVLKYPAVFSRIGALIIGKIDLAPFLEFNIEKAVNECRSLNRLFVTHKLSAKTGEGVQAFCDYLAAKRIEAFA